MRSKEESDQMRVSLQEVDQLLAALADFRSFPGLLTHDDPHVQGLVERVVLGVRDARMLTGQMLDRLEDGRPSAVPNGKEQSAAVASAPEAPAEPPPEPISVIAPPAHLEQITMANPTGMRELILVVDHDAAALAEIEEMLTAEDYRMLSVRDGFEAISIYARLWAAIDLVILDFSLPGISGDLVFDELQAINPNVAAVVSSGFTHPEKLKQMLAQGLSGFLPKPYERERLLRQIQQVLAHRPSGR